MNPMYDDAGLLNSCMTYSKIGEWIELTYGIPAPQPSCGVSRLEQLQVQIRRAVLRVCEEAAREGIHRGFRKAAANLPENKEDGLLVPACNILINTEKLGVVAILPFTSEVQPNGFRRCA